MCWDFMVLDFKISDFLDSDLLTMKKMLDWCYYSRFVYSLITLGLLRFIEEKALLVGFKEIMEGCSFLQ